MLAPIIILGGIYSGLFTPTESAIVAIFYTLVVGLFLHRELAWKPTLKTLETTTWITGRVLLILFTATVFGRLLVEQRVPAYIAEVMLGVTDNTYAIWAMIIFFLLFVGMFMETLAAIMILTPVLLPIMYMLGMDPVHVGIVVVCALAIGFQTPPLGENLFVASGRGAVTKVQPPLHRGAVHNRLLPADRALAARRDGLLVAGPGPWPQRRPVTGPNAPRGAHAP